MKKTGKWQKFDSENELNSTASDYRINKTQWEGPGWYWVSTYQKRCPRGCCYDDVIETHTPQERAEDISKNMKELAGYLKEARNKIQYK